MKLVSVVVIVVGIVLIGGQFGPAAAIMAAIMTCYGVVLSASIYAKPERQDEKADRVLDQHGTGEEAATGGEADGDPQPEHCSPNHRL